MEGLPTRKELLALELLAHDVLRHKLAAIESDRNNPIWAAMRNKGECHDKN